MKYIDWLFIVLRPAQKFFTDMQTSPLPVNRVGLQNFGPSYEEGGIFIVPHLLWHGASVYPVSSEGPPHSVASYDTQGDVEDLF
jgi:hypothetical protein